MHAAKIKLEKSWQDVLLPELQQPYMAKLWSFLENEYGSGEQIYPPKSEIFAALNHTPFDKVKVVVIGQDPYLRPGQAHGLCFSVPKGVKPPRSLQNIFKELRREYPGFEEPGSGDLSQWAKQGVLLLNSVLTVEEGDPRSHRGEGWERFTDKVIEKLCAERKHLVFLLWGRDAQEKAAQINPEEHCVLKSSHPSPLSFRSGNTPFWENNHFKKANKYLREKNQEPIDWQL